MPIYAYKCTVCFYEEDVLQKISEPVLTICPNCQATSFVKKITAAQFHLKGSGWYVTDFRDSDTRNNEGKLLPPSTEKNSPPSTEKNSPSSTEKNSTDCKKVALKSESK